MNIWFFLASLLLVFSGCIYLPASPGPSGGGQAPVVTSFYARPDTIAAGDRAQLSWEVNGATSVSIDNEIGTVALNGTRTVLPNSTTTYILTATNQYGTTTARVKVHVLGGSTTPSGSPVINSFTASPTTIGAGEGSTLSWNISNATSASISPVIGSVNPVSGSGVITPGSTTTFTLTASNAAGSTNSSVTITVTGSPAPGGLPTINAFGATPSVISPGESTTLSWNVSDAAQVTISGIGSVANVGSQSVSPASTTTYTLTATSSGGGWVSKTITVSVGILGPPPVGKPDLIIQSISKIDTPSGYIIGFKIKNNGPLSAGASISRLFVEGIQKSDVNVPVLPAGADYDGSFPAWIYSPLTPNIKVVADATGIVAEADETNNEKTVTMAVAVIYDFVNEASSPSTDVRWSSGAGTLTFGGAIDDPKGFACYRTNITLEDNNIYDKVLETHPQWVDNGYISGAYMELYNTLGYQVKAGDHFYTKCGFIKNATAGKVRFSVMIRLEGSNAWIAENVKAYDGTIKTVAVDLTPYAGKKADFILKVSAEGSSGQDWAVWYQTRIIR